MEFIETFPYIIKYNKGKDNVVADSLSKRHVLLTTLDSRVLGSVYIKELYEQDIDFKTIYVTTKLRDQRTSFTCLMVSCSKETRYAFQGVL